MPHDETPQCTCDEDIEQLKRRLAGCEMEIDRLIRLVDAHSMEFELIENKIGYRS